MDGVVIAPQGAPEPVVVVPAPAEYMTRGEVDARLELMRVELSADIDERVRFLGERVTSAQESAYEAQDAAAQAQGEANLALDIADAVADQVADQEETDSDKGKSSPGGESDDGDDTPRPPERKDAASGGEERKKRSPWKSLFPNG